MRQELENENTRNVVRRISETGDPRISPKLHHGMADDRNSLNTAKKQQRNADESGSAVIKNSEGHPKSFIYRENSSDSSAIADLLEKKNQSVFRQYNQAGESIDELEETPEKQMIDEIMGRKNLRKSPKRDETPELQSDHRDEFKHYIKSYQDHVHKTSSVGQMTLKSPFQPRLSPVKDEAILVSNAQSRLFTDSLVSGVSIGKISQPPLMEMSTNPSPMQVHMLPNQSTNRFEDMKTLYEKRKAAEEV